MESKDVLLSHMEDLAERACKAGCAASRFLTPAEARSAAAHFARRQDVTLSCDGGYESAERVRAILLASWREEYDRPDFFAALRIEVSPRETAPGHRDILGALMGLGIDRSTVGDIMEEPLVLICLPEMRGFIAENFTKAGRIPVTLSEVGLSELPARTETLTCKTDTVASLRLDAVLCAAFGLSRNKASELISAGRVNLDHEVCLNPAKELGEGALLSVRGLGRARLLKIGGTSKKGRIFIQIGLYMI